MGRKIKFRAWHSSNQMIEWESLQQNSMHFVFGGGSLKLMQYTGLTDRKGMEIYEGDIILSETYGYPMEIRWDEEFPSFYCHDKSNNEEDHLNMEEAKEGEIIGNIYQHPELLKQGLPQAIESTESPSEAAAEKG